MTFRIPNLQEAVQTAIDGAEAALRREYPDAHYTVLVCAVPISNEFLADVDPVTVKREVTAQIQAVLPDIAWPFERCGCGELQPNRIHHEQGRSGYHAFEAVKS